MFKRITLRQLSQNIKNVKKSFRKIVLLRSIHISNYFSEKSEFQMNQEVLDEYLQRIQNEVEGDGIVCFIKGSKYVPECGYSQGLLYILDKYPIKYKTYDVNSDALYKEAIKIFSDWPTFPMLYVDGQLVGGFKIIEGFDKQLDKISGNPLLQDIFEKYILVDEDKYEEDFE